MTIGTVSDMQLTAHFTLDELVRSDYAVRKGIDNTPDADVLANIYVLADGLERVRNVLSVPIHVSSGYRCPKLNAAIGGARTSAHMQGLAADFVAPQFGTPKDIVKELTKHEAQLAYDQVILEFPDRPGGWVHIAFSDAPRGMVLAYDGKSYKSWS